MATRLWLPLFLFAAGAVARLFVLVSYPAPFDDAYIVLRVARNLAEGHGFVYNVGERVQASTSPLYTLLVAGFNVLAGQRALDLARVVTSLADAAAAALVFLIVLHACRSEGRACAKGTGEEWPAAAAAGAAGILYAIGSTGLLPATMGLETGLYTLVIAMGLWAMVRGKPWRGAVAGGAAFLLRPDGAILAAVAAGWLLHRYRLDSLRELATIAALTVPWLIFATC